MIDRSLIGYRVPPFDVDIEKGRLRLFAKAIGETNPIYFDETAAQAAGFRSLPAPPTLLFCLEMERPDPYQWFREVDIPLGSALHGEQHFEYQQIPCAGDVLTYESEIVDIYDKKDGALEFIVQDVHIHNQFDQPVARFSRTIVIKHNANGT